MRGPAVNLSGSVELSVPIHERLNQDRSFDTGRATPVNPFVGQHMKVARRGEINQRPFFRGDELEHVLKRSLASAVPQSNRAATKSPATRSPALQNRRGLQ